VGKLGCQSCPLDGEVVLCGDDGIPVFNRLRYGRQVKGEALLCAFDLLVPPHRGFDGLSERTDCLASVSPAER
jgi:ATP-dependent DNA ligase